MSAQNIIALISDFGEEDPYVGILKGTILGINPEAEIVDVCHKIAPGDIKSASFALQMAFPYFPESTIFLVVVDPGVGTSRKGIAAKIDGRIYVGPDNGLLSWVLKDRCIEQSVELSNDKYFLAKISNTFHGRDIFAPVAANIAKGVSLADFGPELSELCRMPIPAVVQADRSLKGEVIYVDHFGSLLTNISIGTFEAWRNSSAGNSIRVNIGSLELHSFGTTYASVPHGHPVVLPGSAGVLEIAVNGGSAAESFNAEIGTKITAYHI